MAEAKTLQHIVAIEDMEPNHFVAWVLDLPGCFSSSTSSEQAIAQTPEQIAVYFRWLHTHDPNIPIPSQPFSFQVVERFSAFVSSDDPDYLVNAFFDDDKRPLTFWDVVIGQRILEWSHEDLIHLIHPVISDQTKRMPAIPPIEKIEQILTHLAQAENWYFGHLDCQLNWSDLPEESIAKLDAIRNNTYEQLMILIGDERIITNSGEKWSARKILRRTIWHERDHTQHIAKLLSLN